MAIANLALSNRKNVPQKMRRYSENGDKLSSENSRVNCTLKGFYHVHVFQLFAYLRRRIRANLTSRKKNLKVVCTT
jgi:hypothetical protein